MVVLVVSLVWLIKCRRVSRKRLGRWPYARRDCQISKQAALYPVAGEAMATARAISQKPWDVDMEDSDR